MIRFGFLGIGFIGSVRKRRGDIAIYKGDKVVVEQGTVPRPSLDDGLKAQAIAEAATESFHSGRPVSISY
jgi:predicted dehydrogenase